MPLKSLCYTKIFLSICVLFFTGHLNSIAQDITDAEVKAALLYNFIKHISYSDTTKTDRITVGIYGEDVAMTNELSNLHNKKVRGKRINLVKLTRITTPPPVNFLFVFNENNYDLTRIYRLIKEKQVLLISDRYDEKREVMINFIHEENNKIQFEINSKNSTEAGFTISPKLLLIGGTELDIRKLYKETEESLISERERAEEIEDELVSKLEEINSLTQRLKSLYKMIDSYQALIVTQLDSIETQRTNLKTLNNDYANISVEANLKSHILDSTNSILFNKNREIKKLDFELEKKQQKLEVASLKIDTLQKEYEGQKEKIEGQNLLLKEQALRIRFQKFAIFTFISFMALLMIFFIFIYRSYKAKYRQNIELEVQKNRAEEALKKLQEAQAQLVTAEKMASLGQLTSGVAHEINNPINYISSSIEGLRYILSDVKELILEYDMILDKYNDPSYKTIKEKLDYEDMIPGFDELTSNIKMGVDRTKEIVNSLRTFARSDDDSFSFLDISDSINSVLILLNKELKGRINIEKDYQVSEKIECLPGKVNQAFMNILVNAIQAIPEKGTISIRTETTALKNKEMAKIIFRDTGTGMPPETCKKIFEPFFTTKDVGQGTGLGMSITYGIVQRHKGHIEIDSAPGMGTSIIIYLPLKQT